ncbi:DUF7483 domain-containing protein [Salidesulfovibrio brasiliensis]|uniref:DUF7483 domain-containing protein n=1 Tax=Salidesulfovibrio brasiliensis TaxID=221711 RepID=UPI0006D0AD53|nr:hypothetical protein [Salidesulfovibrio brasiliensis]
MRPFDHPLSGVAGGGGGAVDVWPYEIGHSALLDGASSLQFTPAAVGNRRQFALVLSLKISALPNVYNTLFSVFADSNNRFAFWLTEAGKLHVFDRSGGVTRMELKTDAECVDTTNHFTLGLFVDTTQATESERVRLFVNGTRIISFSSETYPAQNYDTNLFTTVEHVLGAYNGTYNINGNLSAVHLVEGVADMPDFGGFSSVVSGLWVPQAYTGGYGANGSHPDFADAANLGKDASGNGNDWTVSGALSQSDDTPAHNGGVAAWRALPEPDVLDPATGVAVVLRDGTGAAGSVGGLAFGPDSVLTKDRYNTRSWCLQDTVRGPENCLFTDLTNAEDVKPGAIPAFNADGYDLGNQSITNDLGSSYIDLCLKRGPEFGFDIVSGINHTSGTPTPFDHALDDSVEFGFVRRLDDVDHWWLFHRDLGADKYLCLNLTQAATTSAGFWAVNTSTQFCVPSSLGTGIYAAYLFRSVPGFSKVFSYTGNNPVDGPFADLGFTPLAMMLKNADGSDDWQFSDSARDPYNPVEWTLRPNEADVEYQYSDRYRYLSNGFKITDNSGGQVNGAGNLYVGIAWAAQPFKYSNAF